MRIELRQNLNLPDLGALGVGIHDVPDGLAAALVYQGAARLVDVVEVAPSEVKAAIPPSQTRAGRRAKEARS